MSIKTAIIGASGYTGSELLRILESHPQFEVEVLTANTHAGKNVTELYPHLSSYQSYVYRSLDDVSEEISQCDLVFCGLPHGESMGVLPGLENSLIVDLGSDFRFTDPSIYRDWYGYLHVAPEQLDHWTYGLTELFRTEIKEASRIANPGCYATAVVLAMAPLLKEKLIEGVIVADAVSGISGAGRGTKPALQFSHVAEDVRAYKVCGHQHTPEMEMALFRHTGVEAKVCFTPHLAPLVRGIHATCSASLSNSIARKDLLEALTEAYAGERFISVTSISPGTKDVRGSNRVALSAYVDNRTERAVITSVVDNLVKGAAGQAVQNANIVLGPDEGLGLTAEGMYP